MIPPQHEDNETKQSPRRLGRLRISVVLRVLSILAFIIILIWFVQKMPNENGSFVPVVSAPDTPMRIVPENPGGLRAAYQGLAVNEVPSNQPKAKANDLLLAPLSLKLPDLSGPFDAEGETPSPQTVADLIGQILEGEENPTAIPKLAVRVALLPKPQPISNNFAQIGVFESEEEAVAAWIAFSIQFKPYLGHHQHLIQQAVQNGAQIFRLRVSGFVDVQAVRRFCAVITQQNADCFPVT